MPTKSTPEERFWSKVNRDGPVPDHCPELGPCWIWTGQRWPNGYGKAYVRVAKGVYRDWGAHRVAYVLTHGSMSGEKPWVLHKCDAGPAGCVRPDHLFAGTPKDNTRDAIRKGRSGLRPPPVTDQSIRMAEDFASGVYTMTQVSVKYGLSYNAAQSRVQKGLEILAARG